MDPVQDDDVDSDDDILANARETCLADLKFAFTKATKQDGSLNIPYL